MIILGLRLGPFAGVTDKEISFVPGLNVVLGPNEAGKSTLVSALRLALFQSTQYSKREFQSAIQRFLPVGGGDTIKVELHFCADETQYTLHRRWGGKQSSEVSFDGQVVADENGVGELIEKCLGQRRGTYENVLAASQAQLPATLRALSENPEPANDLAQLLRAAVFETDGVSIEKLGSVITSRHQEISSRWDGDMRAPSGGRGIENRWKREVGEILEAWYHLETLGRELKEARDHETAMDTLNKEVTELSAVVNRLKTSIDDNKEVVEAVRRRQLVVGQKRVLEADHDRLKAVNKQWPVLAKQLEDWRIQTDRLGKKAEALTEELERAKSHEKNTVLLELSKQVKQKQLQIRDSEAALQEMKPIDRCRFEQLQQARQIEERARIELKAGKISLAFSAKNNMSVCVQRDLEDPQEHAVDAGSSVEVVADGRIAIEHDDWHLAVETGEVDFARVQEDCRQALATTAAILAQLGCDTLDEATNRFEAAEKQRSHAHTLKEQLKGILGERTLEQLEAAATELGQEAPARIAADVAQELAELKGQIEQVQRQYREGSEKVGQWEKEYGSQEGLLDRLLEVRGKLQAQDEAMATLPQLPEGVSDAEALVREYDHNKEQLDDAKAQLNDKKVERAELKAPERTSEELDEELVAAQVKFQHKEKEGRAVCRIQQAYEAARNEMDGATLDPWMKDLEAVVKPLTQGRYQGIDLDHADGGSALRVDNAALPYVLLSQGTRSCLGLAIRLTMARRFLQDKRGFLVLDDPLVDLDPERQQIAGDIVRAFADGRQVIVLTCHPTHAEMLGGNRIEMSRTA